MAGKCPLGFGTNPMVKNGGTSNKDWWPNQLNLKILSQHSNKVNPLGNDFDYAKEFEKQMRRKVLHIPVENEHLFRFKMNADSGLRVHRFRTPQCTYSDVR